VSLQTRDAAEAERVFAERLAALTAEQAQRPSGVGRAPEELSLLEIAPRWLRAMTGYTRRSRDSHSDRIFFLGRWLVDRQVERPSQVTPAVTDEYIRDRGAVVSRRTINHDLQALRVCLRWAAERGLCKYPEHLDRVRLKVPVRTVRRVVPSPKEVAKILDVLPAAAKYRTGLEATVAGIAVLYGAALRVSELSALAEEDLTERSLRVRPEAGPAATATTTKGYRERSIPVDPSVLVEARTWLAYRDPTWTEDSIKKRLGTALGRACADLGLPRFGLHDLRRGAATEWARAGLKLTQIRDLLGHQLASTTEGYLGCYAEDEAVRLPVPAALRARARKVAAAGAAGAPSATITPEGAARVADPSPRKPRLQPEPRAKARPKPR
jgi:integrase